ncbi:MAG: DEAD/DEAH box helicase, partial [Proteobacteria bacterium]
DPQPQVVGELRVDEDRVVSLRALLDAVASSEGRFVALGDAGFVALTDEVRGKLDALARAQSVASKGRLGAALLPAVDQWTTGLEVEWSGKLAKRRTEALPDVEVPKTLRADLRDYQREGFQFLARRTTDGTGAILADDMGLGKTVQAIALLLERGPQGPALVVMPTSVQSNWRDELGRFAPSLTVKDADAEAGPNDVVLVSYGMLVADEAALAARSWHTLVFDEAHALKNPTTRRWAAARGMNADATVLLTGTPVENHVGELHALFDVIAPGLLGSRAAFQRAFGIPIARGQRDVAAALRQMVRPLLLRRTKAEVLGELPPKTEMQRTIVPSTEERAFYEAVRRRAQERLVALRSREKGRGQAHIEILSEIMRLRRAAIDPRLVGGPDAPPGGKLAMLVRLVSDLRAEGHRALVFSQFLEVLDLAKEALALEGVVCRRLDGSLNAAERAAEVEAFQGGSGDVFLLSLRAGGVGMNLTGADYVIHLDPWWNPAVEDQATDRAHRIGQERPVTVVRMVTEGTIEEKVLALHGEKRRLYADLVGEADGKGTLDFDQLASLLA